MDLLLKRGQTQATRVRFSLWAKLELSDEEQALIERYRMRHSALVSVAQPGLFPLSVLIGLGVFVIAAPVFVFLVAPVMDLGFPWWTYLLLAVLSGAAVGFIFYNENRETILVADLLHGRTFTCKSVIELARKEAYLQRVSQYFRQVLESAKTWGNAERVVIDPLPPEEAKRRILSGPFL